MLVLHHPAAARAIAAMPAWLDGDQKGFAVLRELLETARAEPKLTTAQLVERWRERPEGAGWPSSRARKAWSRPESRGPGACVPPRAHRRELGPQKRLNELIELERERRLSDEEQKEFQGLLGARGPAVKR